MDFYWDHYLTRESIMANEGPGITLIEEETTPAAAATPGSNDASTAPGTAPAVAPEVAPDSAPAVAEPPVPTEAGYSPVPIVDPVVETVCETPTVLAAGRVHTEEFEAAVTYPRAREAPELLDLYGMLADYTRAEHVAGRTTQASPRSVAPAIAAAQSPGPEPPVSQSPEVAPAQTPENGSPLPRGSTPPLAPPPVPQNVSPQPQAPLDLSAIRGAHQGRLHADELYRERPTTQLVCRYLVCRAYEARIVAVGQPPFSDEHAEDARVYLTAYSGGLLSRINMTLDQAGYMLNRITYVGLTALIEMREDRSPREEALNRLNLMGPQDPHHEIAERGMRAMFNHLLRNYLN